MKEIKLSRGLYTQVDDEDYTIQNQYKWYARKIRQTYYASRHVRVNGKDSIVYLHNEIMQTPKGMETDHRDRNGLHNEKENLRVCTKSQNAMNKMPLGICPYKGVTFVRKKYIRATIRYDGVTRHIGLFPTIEEAARAYDALAKEHFGEYANLNFPDE